MVDGIPDTGSVVNLHEGGRRMSGRDCAHRPLISIVIVIFNDPEGLDVLLKSIASQCVAECEVIVVDGGSGQATLDCLMRYETVIEYWRSEPDRGIYDAMNKGIGYSTGKYIWHLNAGDRLLCAPVEEIRLCGDEEVEVACFPVLMSNGRTFLPRNSFLLRLANTWHHQGTLYLRALQPHYDLKYRVYSDFDLNQRLKRQGARIRIFGKVISYFSLEGASASGSRNELYSIIRKNFGVPYLPLAFIRFHLNELRSWFNSVRQRNSLSDVDR